MSRYAPLVNRKQSNFCGNFPVTDGEGKPLKVMVEEHLYTFSVAKYLH